MKRIFEQSQNNGNKEINLKSVQEMNEEPEENQANAENLENGENQDENVEKAGPSTQKKKKRTSKIWEHFSIKISEQDLKTETAHCNYCNKIYSLSGKVNGSTGNLKKHLEKAHSDKLSTNSSATEENFKFSNAFYRQALVKWVIMTDQPFTQCTEESFLEMIDSLNPDASTISNQTVKRDVMAKFEEEVKAIKLKLGKESGKFSFTLDAWTSKNMLPFMAIRVHWINSDWVYESVLLDFCFIEGAHSGQNFCKIFVDCLKRFEIPLSKILALTMDNVYSNDTFMDYLRKHGIEVNTQLSSPENRVRCMAHILNLAVQDILSSLNIPLNHEEDKYGHLDVEEDDADIIVEDEEESDEDDDEHVHEKSPSKMGTVSKLRKLIKKIRKSPQKRQKLKKLCQFYDIKYLVPIIDVKTRWNSTFEMIQRADYLKTPLRAICSNEKSLNALLMKENEWVELNSLNSLLQKFHRSTVLLSMERHPTICSYLPTLNWLLESLELFIQVNTGSLASATKKGLEKLKKYEEELQIENSKLPYVAVFLNPALKMSYFKEHNYTKQSINQIQKSVCAMFQKNYAGTCSNDDTCADQGSPDEFFTHMYKRTSTNKVPTEFQKYMSFPLSSEKINIFEYWRSQKEEFSNLSNMARDYLAIQSTSVAVERDFSIGTHVVTPTTCSLLPETIRARMCVKSWFKNCQANQSVAEK